MDCHLPTPSPESPAGRSKGQSTAQRNGAALETDLAVFHGELTDWYVQQNYPRALHGKMVGKGPPDFIACHVRLGAVLFDAKSTTARKWPVSFLEPHQAAALDWMERVGGRSAIYLRTAAGDFWVPWGAALRPIWRAWWSDRAARHLDGSEGIAVAEMDWTAALVSP